MAKINFKREWLWVILISLLVVALANLPHLVAYLSIPKDWYFLGHGYSPDRTDINAYLVRIVQGRRGSWLFEDWYTPEATGKTLFYLIYLALGHLGALLRLNDRATLLLGRLLSTPFLLSGLYALISTFLSRQRDRLLAFLALTLPSSLDMFLTPFNLVSSTQVIETQPFLTIGYVPHFLLGLGALCWSFWAYWKWREQGQAKWFWVMAMMLALLGISYPFALATVGGTLAVFVALSWLKHEPFAFKAEFKKILLAALVIILVGLYFLLTSWINPYYRTWWWHQQTTRVLNPLQLLSGYGLWGFMGLTLCFYWLWTRRHIAKLDLLVMSWLLFSLFAYYSPIMNFRRSVIGWGIPLVLLCFRHLPTLLPRKFWRWILILSTLLAFATVTQLLGTAIGDTLLDGQSALDPAEYSTLLYLKKHEPTPVVVLTKSLIGNYLPAVAEQKVVYGIYGETLNSDEKLKEVWAFYQTPDDADHLKLLQQYHVKYLYFGWEESIGQRFRPDLAPYLQLVYQNSYVRLYRVQL